MKMNMYALLDRVAEECAPPFFAKNDGVAWRKYDDLLGKSGVKSRADYGLFRIASFDSETMALQGELIPVEITRADDVDANNASVIDGVKAEMHE